MALHYITLLLLYYIYGEIALSRHVQPKAHGMAYNLYSHVVNLSQLLFITPHRKSYDIFTEVNLIDLLRRYYVYVLRHMGLNHSV